MHYSGKFSQLSSELFDGVIIFVKQSVDVLLIVNRYVVGLIRKFYLLVGVERSFCCFVFPVLLLRGLLDY
jgi:hypothetical protein